MYNQQLNYKITVIKPLKDLCVSNNNNKLIVGQHFSK